MLLRASMRHRLRPNPILLAALLLSACRSGSVPLTGNATPNFDFGSVPLGSHSTGFVTLTSASSAPMQILTVGAPSDPEFTVALDEGTTIDQGGTVNVPVSFKPFSVGAKAATVAITTSSQTMPAITLTLTGTGITLEFTVNPQLVDFGNVVVHTQSWRQLTIENQSTVDLTITPSALQGPDAALFTSSAMGGPIVLPSQGSQTLTLGFSPLNPSASATASFVLASTAGDNVIVSLEGTALQSGLCIAPNPLDFGFVAPGGTLTKPLHLSNCGNEVIALNSASVVNAGTPQAAFSAPQLAAGVLLAPGEETEIDVTFQPVEAARYAGELDIASSEDTGIVAVVLQGYGGGAQISCTPGTLSFGEAALGYTTTLPVICTNVGTDVYQSDGRTIDPNAELIVGDPRVSNPLFSWAFDPPPAGGAVSLRAGESIRLDMGYSPTAAQTDTGLLTINSNVLNPPAPPVIALSGSGIAEGKCFYSLAPAALDFGQVTPLVPLVDGFTITNLGPNECLVTDVDLTPTTDTTAFTLPDGPIISQRLSPPSGGAYPSSLTVPVRFEPPKPGPYSGAAVFSITDEGAPIQIVDLSGLGESTCLIVKPNPLKFPTVGVSGGQLCQTSQLEFTLANACARDATISALAFSAGNQIFQLLSSPAMPFTVASGSASQPIVVGFKPTAAGTFYGSIQITSNVTDQPIVALMTGEANNGTTQTDQFVQQTPQVDLLWVFDTDDDWAFWGAPYANFAQQLQDFLKDATGVDYQMGITTVEVCSEGDQGNLEPCPGCHNTSYDGTSNAFILTPQMADPSADMQNIINNIKTDACMSNSISCCAPGAADEHFLQATQLALDPNSTVATHNAGFLRDSAFLSLILVNADQEDDYSPEAWQSYVQFFQGLKSDPSLFTVNYLIADPNDFVSTYPNLGAMVKQTGGVLVNQDYAKWAQPMAAIWAKVLAANTTFHLSGTADPSTIAVYLGGPPPDQANGQPAGTQLQANNSDGSWNWKYDSTANAVLMNAQVVALKSGDPLFIEYTPICGP